LPKRYLTGGGKRLKKQRKSSSYLNNILKKLKNFYQNLTFAQYERRASAGCSSSKFLFSWIYEKIQNLKKILTFARYDRIGGEGSRTQKIREANHFLKFLITKSCRKREITATNCFSKLAKKLHLHSANCGVILIEFAVCMPILIILLFYINDLVRIKRYYSQTEFVAQQMANIIQNISQKRAQAATTSEERTNLLKIKQKDLKYAMALAYQTIYPGITMFKQGSGFEFGHRPYSLI
jgi:hypothetical protein